MRARDIDTSSDTGPRACPRPRLRMPGACLCALPSLGLLAVALHHFLPLVAALHGGVLGNAWFEQHRPMGCAVLRVHGRLLEHPEFFGLAVAGLAVVWALDHGLRRLGCSLVPTLMVLVTLLICLVVAFSAFSLLVGPLVMTRP